VWKSAIRGDMADPTDDLALMGEEQPIDFGNLIGDIVCCLDKNPDNISAGLSASFAFSKNFLICWNFVDPSFFAI
jgi:hypothetical protein